MNPKYYGEQDYGLHQGHLHWPGTPSGFPVRHNGPVPPLKQHEVEQIEHVQDFHCKEFRTWVPEELEEYSKLMDRVLSGQFILKGPRLRQPGPDGQGWRIWVEWAQVYGVLPTNLG